MGFGGIPRCPHPLDEPRLQREVQRTQQRVLVGVEPVDGADGHARLPCDVGNRDGLEPCPREQRERGALIVRRPIVGEAPVRFEHEVRFAGIGGLVLAQLLGPGFRRALPPTMEAVARRAQGIGEQ